MKQTGPINPVATVEAAKRIGLIFERAAENWEAKSMGKPATTSVRFPEEAGIAAVRPPTASPLPALPRNKKRTCGRPDRYVITKAQARERGLIP